MLLSGALHFLEKYCLPRVNLNKKARWEQTLQSYLEEVMALSGRDDITARSPLWKREIFTLQSSLNTFFFFTEAAFLATQTLCSIVIQSTCSILGKEEETPWIWLGSCGVFQTDRITRNATCAKFVLEQGRLALSFLYRSAAGSESVVKICMHHY